jgi:pimeloyl-ACP methyl ester carboxylesterase
MTEDVKGAVAFLKSHGVTKLTLVGADLGANLAINVAADDATVVDVVLLSPGLEQKGIIATDAVKRYGARALLMVASQDDPYGALSVGRLDALASGEKRVDMFADAGRGAQMLNRAPELEGNVVGWINTHWVPRAEPSPAR